jgi:hypothetical protein
MKKNVIFLPSCDSAQTLATTSSASAICSAVQLEEIRRLVSGKRKSAIPRNEMIEMIANQTLNTITSRERKLKNRMFLFF